MKEVQVVDVYKVTTKIEDFDEDMLVVQVWVENLGIRDVLPNGRFGVNIIFESLRKKTQVEEAQTSSICGVDGRPTKSTTN